MTSIQTPHKRDNTARLELQQQLLEAWDSQDWLSQLHQIAKHARKYGTSMTQGRQFQNVCASARAYSDVTTFIYGQTGKDKSSWKGGWPEKLLDLLTSIRTKVEELSPKDQALATRLLRQSHVLMLYRKVGETLAAFIAYEKKVDKLGGGS